jgi:hypothetical protein
MESLTSEARRRALALYADQIDDGSGGPPFDGTLLPYDICPLIEVVQWRLTMVDQLVRGELREFANTLNAWRGELRRWHIWMGVMETFSEEDAWSLQWEFVEPIAFKCLFNPSAARDRFTFVATNAFHQVRLAADETYSDRLDGDPKKAGAKPRFLSRTQSEEQLVRLANALAHGAAFVDGVQSLDGEGYRDFTRNFRNLSSHAIAPRFNVGLTNTVTRRVVNATKLVEQRNGTYKEEEIAGKQAVRYGFGGTPPLPMREMFLANFEEFEKARSCFMAYVEVLDTALGALPASS